MFRLLKVLHSCEKYRIKKEKEKRKKEIEKTRKKVEKILLIDPKEENKEENKDSNAAVKPEVQGKKRKFFGKGKKEKAVSALKLMRKAFFSFSGYTILCLILLMLGAFDGVYGPNEQMLIRQFKCLVLLTSVLILIQIVPTANTDLYREKNLLIYATLPYKPEELVFPKFIRMLGPAYIIMAGMMVPLWIGYGMVAQLKDMLQLHLAAATVSAILFVPWFLVSLACIGVILAHSYTRLLASGRVIRRIIIPGAVCLAVLAILILLDIIIDLPIFVTLFWNFLNVFAYNFVLKWILEGQVFLSILILFLFSIVMGLLLRSFTALFYRKTLLQRYDLGVVSETQETFKTIIKEHSVFRALVLRELRTVKGMEVFSIPIFISSFLIPLGLLVLTCGVELLLVRFMAVEVKGASVLAPYLLRAVVPLSLTPAFANKAAARAYSRDAHAWEVLLLMPIDLDLQLHAKVLSAFIICARGSVPYVLAGSIWLAVQKIIPAGGIFCALLLNLLLLYWVAELHVMRDIRKLNLTWKKPKELVKAKGLISGFLILPFGYIFPLLAGIFLARTRLSTGVALAWVFFFGIALPVMGYFNLFIEGTYRLRELSKEQDEKKTGMGAVKKQAKDWLKVKKKGIFPNFRRK